MTDALKSKQEFIKALVAAQKAMDNATRNAEGGRKNRYANLEAVVDATAQDLAAHGIAIVQGVVESGVRMFLQTRLLHEGGHEESTLYPLTDNPQATASAVTYARRNSALAAVFKAAQDDDGEAAQLASGGVKATAPAAQPVPEWYAIAEGFKQRIDAATTIDAVNEILIKVEAEVPSETARGFLIDRGKKARARLADAP